MKIAFFASSRKMHRRMDAAVTVDAQNATTATWKTAQNAVSHSAHTHRRQQALHTKNLTLPAKRPPQSTRCWMLRVLFETPSNLVPSCLSSLTFHLYFRQQWEVIGCLFE
jgi:hypothetical protein